LRGEYIELGIGEVTFRESWGSGADTPNLPIHAVTGTPRCAVQKSVPQVHRWTMCPESQAKAAMKIEEFCA